MSAPIVYRWDGDAMIPLARFAKECDEQFVIGEIYRLAEIEERSWSSHNHEFAWLKDAWLNLPESIADNFPSPEHLRKRALIETGFYDEMIVDVGTKAGAIRAAAAFRAIDEFSHVVVRGPIVVRRSAKSQSRRAMGKQKFQESKTAILEYVAAMIGVTPEDLTRNAARAA